MNRRAPVVPRSCGRCAGSATQLTRTSAQRGLSRAVGTVGRAVARQMILLAAAACACDNPDEPEDEADGAQAQKHGHARHLTQRQ